MREEGTTEPSEVDQCRCLRVWVPAGAAPRPGGWIKRGLAPRFHYEIHEKPPETTAAGRGVDEPPAQTSQCRLRSCALAARFTT